MSSTTAEGGRSSKEEDLLLRSAKRVKEGSGHEPTLAMIR